MNGKFLPAVVLLMMALVFGLVAMMLFWQSQTFSRNMIRASAHVVAVAPIGGNGQRVAIVEFSDEEGKIIRRKAQPMGSWGAKNGDEVNILYTRKKVFGQDLWNIFIAKDASFRPYRLYDIVGVVLGAAAAVMLAAGVWMLLK